jgi:hypothetical protein
VGFGRWAGPKSHHKKKGMIEIRLLEKSVNGNFVIINVYNFLPASDTFLGATNRRVPLGGLSRGVRVHVRMLQGATCVVPW